MKFFLQGLLLGLSIAAPVGPIGILCIRRTLADGFKMGFFTGLGAATADAAYGAVGFGLTVVSSFLVQQRHWFGLIGGVFLCFLGLRTFLSKPAEHSATAGRGGSMTGAYLSTLMLTLTNPMTILSFVAMFAGFGVGAGSDYRAASALVAGVFGGSTLWWLILAGGVALFRSRVSPMWMRAVNGISGITILAFGVYALWR